VRTENGLGVSDNIPIIMIEKMELDKAYQKGRKHGFYEGFISGKLSLIKQIRDNSYPDNRIAEYLNKVEKQLRTK